MFRTLLPFLDTRLEEPFFFRREFLFDLVPLFFFFVRSDFFFVRSDFLFLLLDFLPFGASGATAGITTGLACRDIRESDSTRVGRELSSVSKAGASSEISPKLD